MTYSNYEERNKNILSQYAASTVCEHDNCQWEAGIMKVG